jgi:membrane protease YdiL (CAAX protease family)
MSQSIPLRRDKLLAAKKIAGVLFAIIFAWQFSRQVLYPALHVPDSAPLILRPILGFLTAWFFVKQAGESWKTYGLRKPDSFPGIIIWTVCLYALMWLTSTYVSEPLANWLGFQPKPSFIVYVHNNTTALIGWLAISWIVGGFIEELLFRGFILTQVSKLFSSKLVGISIGIVSQAALFGLLHLYQGLFGFVYAGITAILLGLVYVMNGRNLWPLVIAHALLDSVSMIDIYRGQ